ncbi:hypothetical protein K492DRAFT_203682 [Lichtheimia hyalospora FSU 10163]|nr:hypothetical protein K492DRAFT_203682 [Lichtheimia hyalospora FSU 10163]
MTQSTVNPVSSTSVPLNGVDPSLEGLVRGALSLGEGKPLTEEDMTKLLETLNKNDLPENQQENAKELKATLEAARQPDGKIDETVVYTVLGSFLSDGQHVQEIANTIGDFEIRF